MHAPATLDDVSSLLAGFAARKRSVGITGADAPGGPAAVPVDEVLSMRGIAGIVDYVPADQIVTVEAGMTVARLQAALAQEQQRLALDPPGAERATVGGVVATGAYGPLRTRYGTVKDAIVGMTIVRADGTIARGGGKVVKNVAGFDVPKLMIGTYGTLALIGTVTFRLHPLPAAASALTFPGCDAAALHDLCTAMTSAQLEPSAVYAVDEAEAQTYACTVRFEGFPEGVAAQRAALADLVKREHRDGARDDEHETARTRGSLQVKITAPASHIAELDKYAIAPLRRVLAGARVAIYPAIGAAFVGGDPAGAELREVLVAARAWAEGIGGTLTAYEAPAELRDWDRWGAPPPSLPLMRALKDRFDPERRLNPGGFVGGL
jgi:glycolate oxidase FAD binding subunit